MLFSSPLSLRATSNKHRDRGLTLVFGSDGQVSLVGYDGGIPSQIPGVFATLTASNTGLFNGPTSMPNLEATSALLTSTLSPSSYNPSSSASLNGNPSSTSTDTDTNLPSIPTVSYPTPSPTAVSGPKDHGVGAPFYLAVVLASISFVGCVAAFVAWWIRSRTRKDHFDIDDPWNHYDSTAEIGSPVVVDTNDIEKGAQAHIGTLTPHSSLPASLVRGGSPDVSAVPHALERGTVQNSFSCVLDAGRFPFTRPANKSRSKGSGSEPNCHRGPYSSRAIDFHARPGTSRRQTELSVQESTHTLGKLCVANRVPGDVTSGDEGGMNMPMSDCAIVSPAVNCGGGGSRGLSRRNAEQKIAFGPDDTVAQEGEALLEPPGPATTSWGRKIDTIAALRRSRRRSQETAVKTDRDSRYWSPLPDGKSECASRQATDEEGNEKSFEKPAPASLAWTSTLKSSFWQAVDAMTGNRSSDTLPSGSRFTPVPHRALSQRSPVHQARSSDAHVNQSQEAGMDSGLTLPNSSSVTLKINQVNPYVPSATTGESGGNHPGEDNLRRVDSGPLRVSRLNRGPGASTSTYRRQPNSLKTDTGSVYSTDSAVARANLWKYGYADSIPSTWSALGASRESQLDLARPLPFPGTIASPGPSSITTLQLDSASVRTATQSESDIIGSDNNTARSGKDANMTLETSSVYSMSRQNTTESKRSTIGHGTASSQPSSATSSLLSRKRGVTTRRKRPKPPLRAPSTASSVQSVESVLSSREVMVRRVLLERRRKIKAAESSKDREDSWLHNHVGGSVT